MRREIRLGNDADAEPADDRFTETRAALDLKDRFPRHARVVAALLKAALGGGSRSPLRDG